MPFVEACAGPGDDVVVGPMTGVANDIPDKANVFGIPATGFTEASRAISAFKKLPETLRRLRELENQVEALRRKLGDDEA